MDQKTNEKIEKIAQQQRLSREASIAQYEGNRVIETKRLADSLEDALAAWKEAFWEENYRSAVTGSGSYSVEPTPEALSILAFLLYESRHSG